MYSLQARACTRSSAIQSTVVINPRRYLRSLTLTVTSYLLEQIQTAKRNVHRPQILTHTLDIRLVLFGRGAKVAAMTAEALTPPWRELIESCKQSLDHTGPAI